MTSLIKGIPTMAMAIDLDIRSKYQDPPKQPLAGKPWYPEASLTQPLGDSLLGQRSLGEMQSIEDKPNLGVFYAPDSLLWEQWWSLNQPSALFGSSEDRSSMAIGLYRQIGGSGPLPDDFAQGYDTNSTDPWNEPNPVTEGTAPSSTSDHMVSNESPITPDAQVHDQLSTDEKSAQKREHDFGDRPSRKSKRRSSSQDDDLNSKLDIKGEGSNVDPVGNRSSNPTQHSIKGRNRIASNKFRVKKRKTY
ncbi:hypothetical protein AUP68_10761 [Ilyonectria robusta]